MRTRRKVRKQKQRPITAEPRPDTKDPRWVEAFAKAEERSSQRGKQDKAT